jgi:hypothetical protein
MSSDLVCLVKNFDEEKRKEEEIRRQEEIRRKEDVKKKKTCDIRGTKFLITYTTEDYLDKNRLSAYFQKLSPVKEMYINFYLGITRVAVWFKKQFARKHPTVFTFDMSKTQIPNTPKIETILGKGDERLKVISSLSESDRMTIRIKEHPRLDQRENKREREQKQLEKKQKE